MWFATNFADTALAISNASFFDIDGIDLRQKEVSGKAWVGISITSDDASRWVGYGKIRNFRIYSAFKGIDITTTGTGWVNANTIRDGWIMNSVKNISARMGASSQGLDFNRIINVQFQTVPGITTHILDTLGGRWNVVRDCWKHDADASMSNVIGSGAVEDEVKGGNLALPPFTDLGIRTMTDPPTKTNDSMSVATQYSRAITRIVASDAGSQSSPAYNIEQVFRPRFGPLFPDASVKFLYGSMMSENYGSAWEVWVHGLASSNSWVRGLKIDDDQSVTIDGNLTVNGNATFNGNLNVLGTLTTWPAIVIDTTTSKGDTYQDNASWTGRVNLHTNRVAFFSRSKYTGTAASDSVKWGTQKFTLIGNVNATSGSVEQWYLVNPDTGSLTCHWWGAAGGYGSGMTTFYNVAQTSPARAQASSGDTYGQTATATAVSAAGDMVIETSYNSSNVAITKNSSQTLLWHNEVYIAAESSCKTATGTTTAMTTTTASSVDAWVIAVALKKATQ